MTMKFSPFAAAILSACLLAACGGGGGGDSGSNNGGSNGGGNSGNADGGNGGNNGGNNSGGDHGGTPPASGDQFTRKGNTLTFISPSDSVGMLCYDLDKPGDELLDSCDGTTWDLKVSVPVAGGRGTPAFWTNSGTSGSGNGGALGGPFDNTWADLQSLQNALLDANGGQIPARAFLTDSMTGAFTGDNTIGSAALEYNLTGDNKMHPNFRVFQLALDKAALSTANTYALQVLGYYNPAGVSGHVSLRLARLDNLTSQQTVSVDASQGEAYVNLQTGAVVPKTDTWHVAFNRYNVRLNPALSGLAAYAGDTPPGLYDANGDPITSAFANPNLTRDSTAVLATFTGASLQAARDYAADAAGSPLQPEGVMDGTPPTNFTVDYGWYTYTTPGHQLTANPDKGALIRSGEGNSYMRFRLADLVYGAEDQQTWTIEYDLQPASAS